MHEHYINLAIQEAKKSQQEVPVGAIIVKEGKIIASANNKKEELNDVSAHAEILAIKEASKHLGNWRLEDTSLYVTLEPCPMCAAAILYSRIPNVIFGAYDPLYGAFGTAIDLGGTLNFSPKVIGGIKEQECQQLLKDFFKEKRYE